MAAFSLFFLPQCGSGQLVIQFLFEVFAFSHSKYQNIPHQLTWHLHVGPWRAYLISIIKCFKVEGYKINTNANYPLALSLLIRSLTGSNLHRNTYYFYILSLFYHVLTFGTLVSLIRDFHKHYFILILSQNLGIAVSDVFCLALVETFYDVS